MPENRYQRSPLLEYGGHYIMWKYAFCGTEQIRARSEISETLTRSVLVLYMNQRLETHSSPASCECGQHIRLEHGLHDTVALLDDEPQKSFPLHAHTAALDASFVHLPSSILRDVACCPASSEPGGREFRDTLHDICLLEQALHDSDNPPHLCLECIQR